IYVARDRGHHRLERGGGGEYRTGQTPDGGGDPAGTTASGKLYPERCVDGVEQGTMSRNLWANMGGKSVLIKSVAIAVILAQIGSYVCADEMRLSPMEYIGTRIGAKDDIFSGKSTFFMEMSECSYILQNVFRGNGTNRCLVIMDELGRGTSTFDGCAIAYSVLNELLQNERCLVLFVTHYVELSELSIAHDPVCINEYMSFVEDTPVKNSNDGDIVFLYQLKQGLCKNSYGINAAKLAGISTAITDRALTLANDLKLFMTNAGYDQVLDDFKHTVKSSFEPIQPSSDSK
ncbi:hypothetical protein RFI_13375, partial [Reticulomyxa filosa]